MLNKELLMAVGEDLEPVLSIYFAPGNQAGAEVTIMLSSGVRIAIPDVQGKELRLKFLSKISQVLPEFVDTRLMPSAPSTMKWILGGSTFLILHQADTLIGKYLPMLKQVGIVDENNKVDIEVAKGFINSAFDKSGTVEYLGFKFDKSDGEALINIMEKYNDNAE